MPQPFGRYELLSRIATGGMGEVFLARERGAGDLEQRLVVKRLLPHLADDAELRALFLDEARTAARLDHPGIVRVLELGDVEGQWFIAMEYVAGHDLRQIGAAARAQQRWVPVGLACRIAADAAAALDYAHQARDAHGRALHVVHRDVSPHNLLVRVDGAVKLIDFGVARASHHVAAAGQGALRGKYGYMSPEQAAEDALDHRSDQFSLGVVLWELLTGRRLFDGASDVATLQLVTDCQVLAPRQVQPELPEALDAIVLRMLARDPAQRFPDLGAARSALEAFLLDAGLPSSSAQLGAFVRELFPQTPPPLEGPAGERPRPERAPGPPGARDPRDEAADRFLERAKAARPGWEPTPADLRAAEAIVTALRGEALALELAASNGALQSPEALLQRLQQLGERSLRAVLDWSWELLPPHERSAAAQLAVFSGEFSLEAVEAVVDLSAFPGAPWALDVVQALKDKALVYARSVGDGGALRFGLLDGIREYALDQLRAMPGAGDAARARLAALGPGGGGPGAT